MNRSTHAILAAAAFAALLAPAHASAAARDDLYALRAEGRFVEALALADSLLEPAPEDVDLLLLKGQLLSFEERHDEALAVLSRARGLAPDYVDLALMEARVHGYRGAPEAALEILEPLVQAHPDNVEAQLLRGRSALGAGDIVLAAEAFGAVVERDPARGDAWIGLGDCAVAQGRIDTARLHYERALDVPGHRELAKDRLEGLPEGERRFALSVSTDLSRFTGDAKDWREGRIAISHDLGTNDRIDVSADLASRFGEEDFYLETRLTHRLADTVTGFASIGATPDADFLPDWRFRAGADHVVRKGGDRLGASVIFAEGVLADYDGDLIKGATVGLTQYTVSGASWVTGKLTGTFDENGMFDAGFALRADIGIGNGHRVFFGVAQEQDTEGGDTTTTETLFGGVVWSIRDDLELFASFTAENRPVGGIREAIGLGVTLRF